jgi:predicted O-methyltransferase YrrM
MLHFREKSLYDFSIFRIIGNDLPPRDVVGNRYKILKFILEHEETFAGTHKGWIVNCIHDLEYREKICDLLRQHGSYYVIIPFNRNAYQKSDRRGKILHAIPINRARNMAIEFGRNIARYTAVLDGDCYFDASTWNNITDFIKSERPSRQYYTVPHTRSTMEHVLHSNEPMGPLGEPMPIIRNDAPLRFDENIIFGQGDKVRFLHMLGHSIEPQKTHTLLRENTTKVIGYVHHLATGDEQTETDLQHRINLRKQSIDHLLQNLDDPEKFKKMTLRHRSVSTNECYKNIQGWFDFQGVYSHLAFSMADNARFVEIGSWLGASICYMAEQIVARKKNVHLYAVDTWEGSDEEDHRKIILEINKRGETLYGNFVENMKSCNVAHLIRPVRMPSVKASDFFPDGSVDVVFIDASHQYKDVLNDIKHWIPKVKKGGIIGGHDYAITHPVSQRGVIRAVNEFFAANSLELRIGGRVWLHYKK